MAYVTNRNPRAQKPLYAHSAVLNIHCLGSTVLAGEVAVRIRARLCPHAIGAPHADAELDVGLGAPLDVVLGIDGPALGVAGRGQLHHVAGVVGETLAVALDDIVIQLAGHGLGRVGGGEAGGVREVELALLRIVDLHLEALARCNSGGMDAFPAVSTTFAHRI